MLHGKAAIFDVILSICSEFYQIGTPHFSLEGVNGYPEMFSLSGAVEIFRRYLLIRTDIV